MARQSSDKYKIDAKKFVLSFWIQSDREYLTPILEIREVDETNKGNYTLPYSNWKSNFRISAQGNMVFDGERDYIYGQNVECSISGFGSGLEQPTKLFTKAGNYVEKFLKTNPYPKTFGDYAIMLAKAFGFTTFIFENTSERTWKDRKYNEQDLVSGGREIDWMINQKAPHIKRLS